MKGQFLTGTSSEAMLWHGLAVELKAAEVERAWLKKKTAESKQSAAQLKAAVRRSWLKKHLGLQNNKCYYCKIPIVMADPGPHQAKATIDHVQALSIGGLDTFENTVAACGPCNSLKGHGTADDLFADPRFIKRIEARKKTTAKSA